MIANRIHHYACSVFSREEHTHDSDHQKHETPGDECNTLAQQLDVDERNAKFVILKTQASHVFGRCAAAHASRERYAARANNGVSTRLLKVRAGADGSYWK